MRFVAEFEVEVFDPVQAAAFALAWGYGADDPLLSHPRTAEEQVRFAVEQAMFLRLDDTGIRAGFAIVGGSVVARERDESGSTFVEMTVPPVRARHGDDDDR